MKQRVIKLLSKNINLPSKTIANLLEVPPKQELGDYAFPCFQLAKTEKKSPLLIAQNLTEKLRKQLPKEITNIDNAGSYVNFFIDKNTLAIKVLEETKKNSWGNINNGKNKTRLVEYSQPNTHKAFHVGHIRGTSLGESLARIFKASGEKVTQINYSGDTGMHIAKWIWCYQKYHSKEKLQNDESWIAKIYVESIQKLGDNKNLQEEVNKINQQIENRENHEINELWEKTRTLSIQSWEKIYEELGAHFDYSLFESQFESDGQKKALELLDKNIAQKDDAVFMDLKKWNLGVWVLLRKDGTVLYSAKDIALALKKFKDFKSDNYLITVGNEQKMHFQQLNKTLELMGLKKEPSTYGVLPFGMVRFPEGKMSSRTGNNILYSDFSKEVTNIAIKGMKKRGYEGKDIEKRALKIAIASIKYSMLKQDPRRTIIFDPKNDVSFEGNTGPYLLYSYARANSITKKAKIKETEIKIIDLKETEIALIKKIDSFPEIIEQAYLQLAPNIIANYSYELAKQFNEFYHTCPVMKSPQAKFRLELVKAFKTTLNKSLDLLGIDVLEQM